jgi:hypothetical protein
MRDEWAEKTRRLLLEALDAWNDADLPRLRSLCDENVVIHSPYIENETCSLTGLDAGAEYIAGRRSQSFERKLVDFLIGGRTLTMLLHEPAGWVVWQVQLSDEDRVREISISYSVGPLFGAPEPSD